MNPHPCRRHCWLDGRCILDGVGDEHRHCYEDIHWCAWLAPLQHDAPRREKR